jgi:hypothetical protein
MPLTVLITDNDLGDSQLERVLLTEALAADVVVRQCRDETRSWPASARWTPTPCSSSGPP